MKLTWLINTTHGPAVGEEECSTAEEAWQTLEREVRAAFPHFTEHHETALRQIKQSFDSRSGEKWQYRSTAVMLTLSTPPSE